MPASVAAEPTCTLGLSARDKQFPQTGEVYRRTLPGTRNYYARKAGVFEKLFGLRVALRSEVVEIQDYTPSIGGLKIVRGSKSTHWSWKSCGPAGLRASRSNLRLPRLNCISEPATRLRHQLYPTSSRLLPLNATDGR
jgi:hypothetical protein